MIFYTHGKRVCGLLFLLIITAAAEEPKLPDSEEKGYCQASQQYLSEVTAKSRTLIWQPDYSCLIDFSSIQTELDTLTLVDTRHPDKSVASAVTGALPISLTILKTKNYLKPKPLLLLNQGFSRAESVRACTELKQAGFQSVRMLVGGVESWRRGVGQSPPPFFTKRLSPKDFIFEYRNGDVVVISDKPESDALKAIGIEIDRHFNSNDLDSLKRDLPFLTQNGFIPAVIVDSTKKPISSSLIAGVSDTFLIEGGIEGLKDYIEQQYWANHKRTAIPNRFMCPNG